VAKSGEAGTRQAARVELDPDERRARNRTVLLLGVLALINAYVLVWRSEGGIAEFDAALAIAGEGDEFAKPPTNACGDDPVRVFDEAAGLIRQVTTLTEGRTLRLGLLGLGTTGEQIDRFETAVRDTVDLSLLAGSGAAVRIASDRSGMVHALEVELSEGHVLQACRRGVDIDVRNLEHPLRADVAVIGLKTGRGGLTKAVEAAGESPELAPLVARTLAHDVDFLTESRPGDALQVLVEKRYLGHHFHRYGAVLGIRYVGAAGRLAHFHYKVKGRSGAFYDRRGKSVRRELLRSPVAWHPVESGGRGALEPRVEFVDGRVGAIYPRPLGAPVVALGDGEIERVGTDGDRGLNVIVRVGDAHIRYEHLDRVIGDPAVGTRVRQGQLIGTVGRSGKTPRAQLRLEIERDGEIINPLFITDRGPGRPPVVGEPIPEDDQSTFSTDVRPWSKALRQASR
jgi:murein DD-endopeptidase MepM/ murein hydrolase activator NlpD